MLLENELEGGRVAEGPQSVCKYDPDERYINSGGHGKNGYGFN